MLLLTAAVDVFVEVGDASLGAGERFEIGEIGASFAVCEKHYQLVCTIIH